MKSVRIRGYSGLHFPAFGLNTERCRVSLSVQSECGKMLTRITPNKVLFKAVGVCVIIILSYLLTLHNTEILFEEKYFKISKISKVLTETMSNNNSNNNNRNKKTHTKFARIFLINFYEIEEIFEN